MEAPDVLDLLDLRPGYRELTPPAAGAAIECLWVRVIPPGGAARALVLPDACVDLIWQAGRGAFVAGPDTGPAPAALPAGTVLIGARFLPGAGGGAFGLPLSELRNLRVDASELLPEVDGSLPPTLEPRAALRGVAATAARLARAGPPDLAVRFAVGLLADPHARVGKLAADIGLSQRQLRRRCDAAVGYGPKTLQRVLRFRHFLARLNAAGPRADLAAIAYASGYADQAHLTRECTRLAGSPPAALARVRGGHRGP
jgi:AraC-like DNA-binding protein